MVSALTRISLALVLGYCVAHPVSNVSAQTVEPKLIAFSDPRFAAPFDLVLSIDKSLLFVTDLGNDRLKVLDPLSLKTIDVIGQSELNSPHDVTLDNRGRLIVADTGHHRVVIFQVRGTKAKIVKVISEGLLAPEGVTVGPDGAIYITDVGNNNIAKYVNGTRVKVMGGKGNGPTQFNLPHDVDMGPKGKVFVADTGNNRIQVLDQNFNLIRSLHGPPYNFNSPKYMKIDDQGWLYVADENNNQIKIFDAGFKPIGVIGSGRLGRKPGELNLPSGVEVWKKYIWVSDTDNSRILLFKR